MQPEYWHKKWDVQQIGFHQAAGNPLLKHHIGALALEQGARIFLPLCGKTGDIGWLLSQGFHVCGAELSRKAIEQLFDELGVDPRITQIGPLTQFSTQKLDIFVGDIFDLTAATLGPVNAVYDRAAYVALMPELRARYTAHMPVLTDYAPHLLITFEYDPTTASGPPFSIDIADVTNRYGAIFDTKALETVSVEGGLKGITPATETVYHLTAKNP